MRRLACLLLVLAPALTAEAQGVARPAAPPGLSWEESESLARKITAFEQRLRVRSTLRETITVTQGEINSFLNLTYASRMPKGVTGVSIRFDNERIEAQGTVDLDQVGASPQKEKSRFSIMSMLSPAVPVLLRGRLVNQDGFGTLVWEEIRLSSLPLPLGALSSMVAAATRSARYPNGVDIQAPFRLPYAARRVRLEPGRAILEF
jgi:hypothetical protein